jgi:hypothetical protein
MANLKWVSHVDQLGNDYWEAASRLQVGGVLLHWRIRQRFVRNRIEFWNDSDGDLDSRPGIG